MNWLESLGLTSIPPKQQVSPFLHLQLGSDLRRSELLLHPSSSGIRRLVSSPPRSKTCTLNWMVQLPKIQELLSPAALQMAFTNALQATQSGAKNNSDINPQTCKPFLGVPREPQLAAGKDGSIDPDKSCNYCKDYWA